MSTSTTVSVQGLGPLAHLLRSQTLALLLQTTLLSLVAVAALQTQTPTHLQMQMHLLRARLQMQPSTMQTPAQQTREPFFDNSKKNISGAARRRMLPVVRVQLRHTLRQPDLKSFLLATVVLAKQHWPKDTG